MNDFIVVEELWEGFETGKRLPCVGLLGLLSAASSAGGVWEVSIIYMCVCVYIYIYSTLISCQIFAAWSLMSSIYTNYVFVFWADICLCFP